MKDQLKLTDFPEESGGSGEPLVGREGPLQ
jgi:hypothetical protein